MTNASTEAIAGALMPTELLTARSSSNERTYLETKRKKRKECQLFSIFEVKMKLTHSTSRRLYTDIFSRNGTSHAKNLMTFIPPRTSCRSFTRLSVHFIVSTLNAKYLLITIPKTGMTAKKKANPARAEGPRLSISSARQISNWIGAVQAYQR